jgi:hypothetical protein
VVAWELGRPAINGGGGRLGGGRLRGGEGADAVRVGGGGALIRARWGGEGTRGCQGRRDGRGGGAAGSWRHRAENSPEHRRKRRSRARGHDLGCGLDWEQEEDSAKLTSCSMTAMRQCRRCAAMRSGRDHGCPPGRGVAASAACSWASRWGPGGPASATGEGEG